MEGGNKRTHSVVFSHIGPEPTFHLLSYSEEDRRTNRMEFYSDAATFSDDAWFK